MDDQISKRSLILIIGLGVLGYLVFTFMLDGGSSGMSLAFVVIVLIAAGMLLLGKHSKSDSSI